MRKSLLLCAAIMFCLVFGVNAQSKKPSEIIKSGGTIKILHIMSFHSPWIWTDYQFDSFKAQLKDIKVEYKVIQLNAKNNKPEEIQRLGKEAADLIESWKPELVYCTDDAAIQQVAVKYINTPTFFVFSGVNNSAEKYGFVGSKNIIGVQEQEHYVETVKLLQKLYPKIKKIAVISDDDEANWKDYYTRINDKTPKELPGVTVTAYHKFKTYKEYQAKILEYNKTKAVDALVYVGWFKFKDDKGENVAQEVVAKWTAENSKIPECSYWLDRVVKGNLCSVTVSGLEQGTAAGKLARAILVDGKEPSSFKFEPTTKGQAAINLARAKVLGLTVPVAILQAAEVVQKFEWDK